MLFRIRYIFLLFTVFLCVVSCKKEFVSKNEREVARTVSRVTGRDMFSDRWINRNYAVQPIILDVSSGSAVQDGFSIDLKVANTFQVTALDNRRISGVYHGLRIHIVEHELSRGRLPSQFNLHFDSMADVSLADIYGMTLDVVRDSCTLEERERRFFLYATKSMLLPEEAKISVQRLENDYTEAFVFGDVSSGRVVADVRLKEGDILITLIFNESDHTGRNGMSLVVEFLSALRGGAGEDMSPQERDRVSP